MHAPQPVDADRYLATPLELANEIIECHTLIAELPAGARVLEPSAGDGALVCAILTRNPTLQLTAIEPNSTRTRALQGDPRVTVINTTIEQFSQTLPTRFRRGGDAPNVHSRWPAHGLDQPRPDSVGPAGTGWPAGRDRPERFHLPTVSDDGIGAGNVVGDMAFMWLRDQRIPWASFDDAQCDDGTAAVTYTGLHPYRVAGDYDVSLAISMRVADCTNIYCPVNGCPEEYRVAFVDPSSDSWATVHYRPSADEYQVHQAGPRQLWDEVATAYRWWLNAGSPKADRWRITVTPHEQLITLAEPATLRLPSSTAELPGPTPTAPVSSSGG